MGSVLTYALVNAFPTISDGIALTGFSLNSSFTPVFIVGSNLVQAYLNQPFRFGNVSESVAQAITAVLADIPSPHDRADKEDNYDLVDYFAGRFEPEKRIVYAPGYLTNSNAGANQYVFFLTGHHDPQIVTFAEKNKQPMTAGELLSLGSASPTNMFEGPVLVLTGCQYPK